MREFHRVCLFYVSNTSYQALSNFLVRLYVGVSIARSCKLISNIHSFLAQLVVKGADNPISNPISSLTQNLTLSLFASQQQEIIIHESPGGMYKAHK